MPMLVVETEENFAALRARLFASDVTPAVAKRIADAVVAANPHVDLQQLRPGTILSIPDLPEIALSGDVPLDDTTRRGLAAMLDRIAADVNSLLTDATRVDRESAVERKELLGALQGPEVQAAIARAEELAPDFDAVRNAIDAQEAEAQERATALDSTRAEWTADLESLKAMLP